MTFDSSTTPPTLAGRRDDYEFRYRRIFGAGGMGDEDTLFNRPKKPFNDPRPGNVESAASEGKGSTVWLWAMCFRHL